MSVDLSRYLKAQNSNYTNIYLQILNKQYDSGWIEFVFPRYVEDCSSIRSKQYGLINQKEAKSFWKTKLLRRNYIEMLKVINKMTKEEYENVFSERGRFKIKQSLDIFSDYAQDEDLNIIQDFVGKYY